MGKHLFICPFKDCNKIYYLKNKLMTHLRTHYGIKPFKCHICSKSFNEKGNLKTHLRIHTGERPYKCKECLKGFKALGQLKDHIISHTVYKPFQCPYCLKFYRRKGILKNHMLIHMKDPSYVSAKKFYEDTFNKINVVSPINDNWTKKYMIHEKSEESMYKNFFMSKTKKIKHKYFRRKLALKRIEVPKKNNRVFIIEHDSKNKKKLINDTQTNLKDLNDDNAINNNINNNTSNNNNVVDLINPKINMGNLFISNNNYDNFNFNNGNQIITNHLNNNINSMQFGLFDENYMRNYDMYINDKEEKENEILNVLNNYIQDKVNYEQNNTNLFNQNDFINPFFPNNNEFKECIEKILNPY